MKRSPIRRRRRTKHQLANVEHAEYGAWIATQPCAVCGTRNNVQVAHLGVGGAGLKHGDDDQCAPLCSVKTASDWDGLAYTSEGCHEQHDQTKGKFARPSWLDKYTWLAVIHAWDEIQIAVHRGRFEARNVGAQVVPF